MSEGSVGGAGAEMLAEVQITRTQLAQALLNGGGAVMHAVVHVTRTGVGGDGHTDDYPITGYLSHQDVVNLDAALAAEENGEHG